MKIWQKLELTGTSLVLLATFIQFFILKEIEEESGHARHLDAAPQRAALYRDRTEQRERPAIGSRHRGNAPQPGEDG